MSNEPSPPDSLAGLIERLSEQADASKTTVGDLISTVGSRAMGPLLFVPALIVISPIGGIPGVPTITAVIITLISIQMIFARDHIWLPDAIMKRPLPEDKLATALEKSKPIAAKVDRFLGDRLRFLVRSPMPRIIATICIALAAMMVPLELVPFGVSIPAAAVLLFSIGLVTEDGAVIGTGLVATVGAAYLVLTLL